MRFFKWANLVAGILTVRFVRRPPDRFLVI